MKMSPILIKNWSNCNCALIKLASSKDNDSKELKPHKPIAFNDGLRRINDVVLPKRDGQLVADSESSCELCGDHE